MSVRSLSVLALGSLLALAACSGGGDGDSSGGKSASESSSSSAGPKYTEFADFPGEEIVAVDLAAPMGLRTKVVDAAWQTELADSTAQAGNHILAVYVAVNTELDDRGLDDAKFHALTLGLRSGASAQDCEKALNGNQQPENGICLGNASVTGQLEKVADDQWREHDWHNGDGGGVPLEPGQTLIGVIGFELPDSTEIADDTVFCAPRENDAIFTDHENCVAIPKLDARS
ncbi:hypothetical protein [Stackebrandtia nassauensis]|uniref:Lipoprotein n=1 Tax=Stackebrandtia nassauensis (strain DSM 44728 / CIP 108903 / NRRL B-16338 / NBRC 102104 / LLR-40K-21) TaxID=446470 RepID=D3Q6D7_STANL|nr:hypothetical protein [Stackebrandtia nassauensis]ADD42312.1 hypothetical protein Snas_2635 [Stackebrandtia nassauensis DSM 44728]